MNKTERYLTIFIIIGMFIAFILGISFCYGMNNDYVVRIAPIEELKCERYEINISENEIDEEISRRLSLAEEDVDKVKQNDCVIITHKGKGKRVNAKGKYKYLIGLSKGDTIKDNTITRIIRKVNYEDYLESKNLTENQYRKEIKKELISLSESVNKEKQKQNIVDMLVEKSTITHYPVLKLKRTKTELVNDYKQKAKEENLSLNKYVELYLHKDMSEFDDMLNESSRSILKRKMVVSETAKLMNISVTNDDCRKRIDYLSKMSETDNNIIINDYVKEETLEDKIGEKLLKKLS